MSRQHRSAESPKPLWTVLLAVAVLAGCGDRGSPAAPSGNGSNPRDALLSISGYVYQQASAAGEPPIADALITLRDAQGAENTTASDRRGFYRIRVTPGEVVVSAAKEGYTTRESRFEVTDSTVLNFGLEPVLR
jgi:hypothetical protein